MMTKHKRQPRKTIVVRPFLHRLIKDGAWRSRMDVQDFLELVVLTSLKQGIPVEEEEEDYEVGEELPPFLDTGRMFQ
jgi:hypothetical protein